MGEITYTDHVRDNVGSQASNPEAARLKVYCLTLCDLLDRSTVEADRLWAENTALAAALADLAEAVKAIPRHYPYGGPEVEDVTGKCLVCGTSWPCPTERAHCALDALEADRG